MIVDSPLAAGGYQVREIWSAFPVACRNCGAVGALGPGLIRMDFEIPVTTLRTVSVAVIVAVNGAESVYMVTVNVPPPLLRVSVAGRVAAESVEVNRTLPR